MSVGVYCTMCCWRQGYVNNMSQDAARYSPFPFLREASSVKVCESAAQQACVGLAEQQQKKQSQRKCVEKEDECFSPNEQDMKSGCSVAMATPARQLAFFIEGCTLTSDQGAQNCK